MGGIYIKLNKSRLMVLIMLFISFVIGIVFYLIKNGGSIDFSIYIAISIVFLFGVYLIRNITAFKNGEVLEDELSKKTINTAASRAFYISLYLWIFMNYKFDLGTDIMLFGVGGMVVIFLLNYFYILYTGKVD